MDLVYTLFMPMMAKLICFMDRDGKIIGLKWISDISRTSVDLEFQYLKGHQ